MLTPDLQLVEKYNLPGPRYTSYPSSPHFQECSDQGPYLQELAHSASPLSLYFHIPFCHSLCYFCGCTKIISSKLEAAVPYLDTLISEIDLYRAHAPAQRPVQQLHFGGGTPNFLSPELIYRFSDELKNRFHFADDAEISVELDPRRLTKEHVDAFRALGVNRFSFGLQDIKEDTQKTVNRIQPDHLNRQAISWAREAGITSLNLDLIYGLPHQTPQSIHDTIQHILSYDPDRLAVFSYAHVPWVAPAQLILEKAGLPSAREKIDMLGIIISELTSAGYQYIGMDHFAKKDDPLAIAQRNKTLQRNFQGYSTFKDVEIAAFGMSSISQTENTYRQNFKTLPKYTQMVESGVLPVEKAYFLSQDDQIRRTTIMRLMCDLSLDFAQMSDALQIDFSAYFAHELASFAEKQTDGLVQLDQNQLQVTPQGSLFIRNIAMHFDKYLSTSTAKHSKTI